MNYTQLVQTIKAKKSYLCIGLDTDINRIPKHLLKEEDPIFAFNKEIIDATKDFCVAYKPNIAFYEALGLEGWASLQKTIDYIPKDCFIIADAKRGDIGNTSKLYAKAFFETLECDAVTVAPYMGADSVVPFLTYKEKFVILLALTSNPSSQDFQTYDQEAPLYKRVLNISKEWGTAKELMFVVGATKSSFFEEIRSIVPDHFLLVPGIGAQGGSLKDVSEAGLNDFCGLLVNSSRGIIYAGDGHDFSEKAAQKAKELQIEMEGFLKAKGIIPKK